MSIIFSSLCNIIINAQFMVSKKKNTKKTCNDISLLFLSFLLLSQFIPSLPTPLLKCDEGAVKNYKDS